MSLEYEAASELFFFGEQLLSSLEVSDPDVYVLNRL